MFCFSGICATKYGKYQSTTFDFYYAFGIRVYLCGLLTIIIMIIFERNRRNFILWNIRTTCTKSTKQRNEFVIDCDTMVMRWMNWQMLNIRYRYLSSQLLTRTHVLGYWTLADRMRNEFTRRKRKNKKIWLSMFALDSRAWDDCNKIDRLSTQLNAVDCFSYTHVPKWKLFAWNHTLSFYSLRLLRTRK